MELFLFHDPYRPLLQLMFYEAVIVEVDVLVVRVLRQLGIVIAKIRLQKVCDANEQRVDEVDVGNQLATRPILSRASRVGCSI